MQLFYFAFRVEQGRLQKLAESNKSVTYKPTWRGISTVAGFIVVIIGTYITIYLWESSDVNKFAEHSKIYVAKRSDLVHEILKSNEKALTDAIKVDLYNNPLYAATVRSEIDASQKLLDKNHILIDNTFTDFERDEKNQNFSSSAQDEFMKGYAEARDQTKEKFANFFQTESNILKFGSILLDFIAAHSSDVTTKDGQFTFATYEEVSQFGQYSAEMKELAEKEQSAIKELQ